MDAVFLDFDGVIVNSIDECFLVSKDLYLKEEKATAVSKEQKDLFFKYRGIAGPAWQIFVLQKAIASHLADKEKSIPLLFESFLKEVEEKKKTDLEDSFFKIRDLYRQDKEQWFYLNPLTDYGKHLQKRPLLNYHIVTTKNKSAVEELLGHYKIPITSIFDVQFVRKYKNKGAIIEKVMNDNGYQTALFVDDFTKHLDTVKDQRVACYFADWGYGKNASYPRFEKTLWDKD